VRGRRSGGAPGGDATVGRLKRTVSAQEQPEQEQQQRSLYRRHRPRTFAEVVGQEPVVRTLRNAVERGKVHHAYLFVGSRGTGKTSMAKILAACLNCERGGPTIEPCGECDSCMSIARANSLDVIEMDAASNNSVDDIRELRESVAYAPVSGRRKVYILDEAHMLTTAAWNAFLKTLEEPPPNTVFVLATTEAGKVPATVVDRCHRFDFHRPTIEQLASVVRRAAQAEGIEIPPAAVAALARSATGSFRDALGTLEQIVTYGGAQIVLEDVLAVLGVADARLLEETVDAIATGDARRALKALEECTEQGRDAGSFAADLEVRARELLVVQTLGEVPAELSLTPEADTALQAQAERVPHATVVGLLELLGTAMEGVRAGADPRTRLELALVKAARPEVDASTQALLARIERLERERGVVVSAAVAVEREVPPGRLDDPGGEVQQPDVVSEPVAVAAPAIADPPADVVGDLESLCSVWPAVVELVKAEHGLCGAVIADARPVEIVGEDVTIGFATTATFLKKQAEDPDNRAIVTDALRRLAGGRWRISYELREELDAGEAGSRPGAYTEEEWVARLKAELDAEEIPLEPGSASAHRPEPAREPEPALAAHQSEPTPGQSIEKGE
jgi:DNA polymerase-3 subunit gamma/tau